MVGRRRVVACAVLVVLLASCGGGGDGGGEALEPIRAVPSGKVVLGDDLATNASLWDVLEEPDLSVTVELGSLVIETTRADVPIVSVPGRVDSDIFDAETAVSLPDEAVGPGAIGVVCRNAEGRFYAFTIDDGGGATIALWDGGERHVLGSAPYAGHPRRLAGRCSGGIEGGEATLQLVLDGNQIVTAIDDTALGAGTSGVFTLASSSAPLTASIDRFEVRELTGGTTHVPPPPSFGGLPEGGFTDDFAGDDGPFGELLIEDEFGGFLAQYDSGTYRMRADGFVQRSAPADPMPDHAAAEVTVTKVSSGPSFRGLRWARDEDRYYEVAIDDGTAVIGYVDGDRDAFVELGRADDVAAIAGGDEPNRIRSEIERASGRVRITLVVNDEAVLEVTDEDRWETLHFSRLFMRSTPESTEPTEVRFDDYSLTAL